MTDTPLAAAGSTHKGHVMAYFYILSMAASICNFLYYPFMSHVLSLKQYSEVQFLVTVLFQVSIFFMALNVITVVLSLKYSGNPALSSKKIAALTASFNFATILISLIFICFLALKKDVFSFDSYLPFLVLGVAVVSSVPFSIGIGRLQGNHKYVYAGTLNVVGSLLKLLLSAIFIYAGWGVTGAILGIAVGQLSSIIIYILMKRLSFREIFSYNIFAAKRLQGEFRDITLITIATIILNMLVISDILLFKYLFSADIASQYASVSTLAKIALYAISPLVWMVIIPASSNTPAARRQVNQLLVLAAGVCLSLLIVYILFPQFIVSTTTGNMSPELLWALPLSTLATSALSLATMTNVILAAKQRYFYMIIQAALVLLVYALFSFVTGKGIAVENLLFAQVASGTVGVLYYILSTVRWRGR
jgi:O-antigen/teichoic acid export membrane protein